MRRLKGIAFLLVLTLIAALGGHPAPVRAAGSTTSPNQVTTMPAGPIVATVAKQVDVTGLDLTRAQAAQLGELRLLRIPGPQYGGILVQVDARNQVLTWTRIVNLPVGQDKMHSLVYVDGHQRVDVTVDTITGKILAGWALKADDTQLTLEEMQSAATLTAQNWLKCMNGCLSAMGVPSWIIGVIGIVCAIACLGTAGAGCIVCLEAALIGYGMEFTACLGWCNARK